MKGRKVPKKKKKEARQSRPNAGSFRGRMNSMRTRGRGLGVNLDLTVKLAMISMPSMRKAQALIVHGNPTFGIRCETMMGKITPPRDDPDAIIPKDAALFLKNQVPFELIAA